MKTVTAAGLVAAILVLGSFGLTAQQTARFRHVTSVYVDDKGAGLKLPEGVACDAKGRLVIGDTGNDRLVRFTYANKSVSGGSEVKIPELSAPTRVYLDSKGEILALDGKRRRIVRLGAEGEFKGSLALDGVPPPTTIVPKSFALDSADNIYVLDAFAARVLVLNGEGRFQRVLPLPDDMGFATDVTVDFAGTVLVVDSLKRRMLSAAKDAAAFAQLGGDLTESVPTLPTFVGSSKGTIFVVESSGSIVSFGRDGSFLARQLSAGWNEGSLNHPSQFCINANDEAFIADRDNSRVQVFSLIR